MSIYNFQDNNSKFYIYIFSGIFLFISFILSLILMIKKYEDIYVVNLTSKEMEELGIYTVKVIVPGLLPITFGVQNERVSMSRINQERSRRGLEEGRLVSPYPHPFP